MYDRRNNVERQAVFVNSEKIKSLEYLDSESVELFLTYCGYKNCDAEYSISSGIRNYYMICIITQGKGSCEINEKVHPVKSGDALLIYPGVEAIFEVDQEEPCSYTWVGFAGVKAKECIMNLGFSHKRHIISVENTDKLHQFVKYMLQARELTFANELRRNGLLKLFIAELIDQYNRQLTEVQMKDFHNTETSAYIRNAISYIAENYASQIKINELADHIGVNRSYLASSFKKAMGYSPKEYLLRLRMEKAKSLLETTDQPINSIANAVGYTDQLAFSRMFKRYSGVSPKTYREENKS